MNCWELNPPPWRSALLCTQTYRGHYVCVYSCLCGFYPGMPVARCTRAVSVMASGTVTACWAPVRWPRHPPVFSSASGSMTGRQDTESTMTSPGQIDHLHLENISLGEMDNEHSLFYWSTLVFSPKWNITKIVSENGPSSVTLSVLNVQWVNLNVVHEYTELSLVIILMWFYQRWKVHGTVVGRAATWQRCGCHPVRCVLWRGLQRQQDECKFTLKYVLHRSVSATAGGLSEEL